jgi:hypothetical protein
VDVVEANPDADFHDPVLHVAGVASSAREHEFQDVPAYRVAKYLGRGLYKMTAAESAAVVAIKVLCVTDREYGWEAENDLWVCLHGYPTRPVRLLAPVPTAVAEPAITQSALARDVFGPLPFRLVTLDSSWRTSTVLGLASAIYAERAFDRLPILADALEDAGCDQPDILSHCRSDGPHVRGCWAVDLVLGKS